MKFKIIFSFVVSNLTILCRLAGQASNDSLIIGVWKGTSLCQVKTSPCHDETVVCHISKAGKPNEYNVLMNKIVNGAEEDMGTLLGRFNPKLKELTCSPQPNTIWKFYLSNKKLAGTLYYNRQLYRKISVTKSSP